MSADRPDRQVDLLVDDGIAVVRLNRPEHRNALSDGLLADLESVLDDIEADHTCRAIVITGTGPAFCAGADLRELLARLDGEHQAILTFVRRASHTFRRLEEASTPVIAAVNGAAVAGGFELVLACDIVLAAEGAMLGDGHLRYGVLPGAGATVRLEQKMAAGPARRLLLTGDLEPAERFHQWGLVDEVLPAEELIDRAMALAHRLASRSALGLREVKRVTTAARDLPIDDALQLEHDAFAGYVASDDLREGLLAFRDGREPCFQSH